MEQDVVIKITADIGNLQTQLTAIQSKIGLVDKSVNTASGNIKNKFSGAVNQVKTVAGSLNSTLNKLGVTIGAAFAVRALVNFGKASMAAYSQSLQAETALRMAMGKRKDIAERLIASSKALMSVTNIPDEVIIQAQSFLAINGKTEEQINTTIKAAIGLSKVLGIDLQSATVMLNGAFSGVTRGLNKLDPQVAKFTKQQLAAGAASELFANKYAGLAESLAQTSAGKMQGLTVAWEELKEAVGKTLVENVGNLAQSFSQLVIQGTKLIEGNPANALMKEKTSFEVLARSVNDEGLTKKRRIELLKKMQAMQPSFLKGLDLEKVTFNQVRDAVINTLAGYQQRIDNMIIQTRLQEKLNSINTLAIDIDNRRNDAASLLTGTLENQASMFEIGNKAAGFMTTVLNILPEWTQGMSKLAGYDPSKNLTRLNLTLAKMGEKLLETTKQLKIENDLFLEAAKNNDVDNEAIQKIIDQYLRLGGSIETVNKIKASYLDQANQLTEGGETGGGKIGDETGKIKEQKTEYDKLSESISNLEKKIQDQITTTGKANQEDLRSLELLKDKRQGIDDLMKSLTEDFRMEILPFTSEDTFEQYINDFSRELSKMMKTGRAVTIPVKLTLPETLEKGATSYTDLVTGATNAGEEAGKGYVDGFIQSLLEIDDEELAAVKSQLSTTLGSLWETLESILQSQADDELEMIEKRIDGYDKLITAQEDALQKQIDLNKEGSASNIKIEQERLDKLKTERDKAIQDRDKQIQKEKEQERTLATIKGAVGLISIWANSFQQYPNPVVAAVIGGLATIAFLAELAAAYSNSAGAITFAHGYADILKGNSHAGGGIQLPGLGEAEGGEFLGILSKDKTKKYGPALKTLFDGLNSADERKRTEGLVSLVRLSTPEQSRSYESVELKEIKEIREIRDIMKRPSQSTTYENGRKIIKFGNVTRIVYN